MDESTLQILIYHYTLKTAGRFIVCGLNHQISEELSVLRNYALLLKLKELYSILLRDLHIPNLRKKASNVALEETVGFQPKFGVVEINGFKLNNKYPTAN